MNIGHHRRKWKSPILGVDEFCFVTFFWLFFSVRGTNTFFIFFSLSCGKILQCSPYPGWGMFLHQNHGAGGGNDSVMVRMCVCLCLASNRPSEREFFVLTEPERT